MAIVHMYSIYNDLLAMPSKENLMVQRIRDVSILKGIEEEFPMDENDAGLFFSLFKELTRQNPILNILLVYKLNGKDGSAILIRKNTLQIFSSKEDAFYSIHKNKKN